MRVMGVYGEVAAVRAGVGLWVKRDRAVLQFSGRDALSWLHSQTTNRIADLSSGAGSLNALLDRQGRVQTFFTAHRWEDACWLLIDLDQVPAIEARLETHLFLEDVRMENVAPGVPQIHVEGPRALPFLASLGDGAPENAAAAFPDALYAFAPLRLLGHEVLAFRMSESGEDGFVLAPAPEEAEAFWAALVDRGVEWNAATPGPAALEALRIEAGQARFGVDIDTGCVIAETPLEAKAVRYDKGCYLGQEVVARLKAYGTPKRAMMGLVITDDAAEPPPCGAALYVAGRKAGVIRSGVRSPTLDAWVALAYLDRDFRAPGAEFRFQADPDAPGFIARVTPLPFHEPPDRQAVAQRLYEEALGLFERDLHDEDDAAIELLKEAVLLAPRFEDAYEALGVILHRHHRIDEAIHYMKILARLNPACVMAHSNLSVFYVAQGRIEEAEHEKAIALQLEQRQHLDAQAAEEQARAERARLRGEAEQRIGMFVEVLEIDPEDPVATMGLGSAYIQLDRHADAIPYLERATRQQKDFSAAYLKLGQCLEVVGQRDAAADAYRRGIEAAGRKGDLMPLREMERRLKALEAAAPAGQS